MRKKKLVKPAPEQEMRHEVEEWAVAFTVNWGNGTAALHSVRVHPAHRRKGLATQLLEKVCTYADSEKLTLILIAESDEAVPPQVLIAFYSKFGFMNTVGTSVMMRPPAKSKNPHS